MPLSYIFSLKKFLMLLKASTVSWLVESEASDRKFIEDLFFPAKLLSINAVWAPGGLQKTKAIISGKYTSRFPIDVTQVAKIVKELRQLDLVIEFEEKK